MKAFNAPPCGSINACTGCAACEAVCPQGCIRMMPNLEGFVYPVINEEICTDCGICRESCPVNLMVSKNNAKNENRPINIYAAWHLNENIRRESSSGGVFTALATEVLERGGVVVGAVFDKDRTVRHISIESVQELGRMRGSKYVQSALSIDLYREIEGYLEGGRYVLFVGTPCQVSGLNAALNKEYDNLITFDLVCLGVPSPKLLESYLSFRMKSGLKVKNVRFRDKYLGWKKSFVMKLEYENESEERFVLDPYITCFLRDGLLRESCYQCLYAKTERISDLTLADFWGVGKRYPQYDDDRGTSLVLVNSKKGVALLDCAKSSLFLGEVKLSDAMDGVSKLTKPARKPEGSERVRSDLVSHSFEEMIRIHKLEKSNFTKLVFRIKVVIRKFSDKIRRKCVEAPK